MPKNMGMGTRPASLRILGLVLVILVLGALSSCVKPDLRTIGAYEIHKQMDEVIETVYEGQTLSAYIQNVSDAPPAQWANDRLPTWAEKEYDGCVYWSATYHANDYYQRVATGRIYGWIAVDYEMNVHILEISFEEDETGRSGILVDGWADPSATPGDI